MFTFVQKILSVSLLLGIGVASLFASTAALAATESVEARVLGLHCEACVGKATKALLALPAVQTAEVKLLGGVTVLQVESGFDPKVIKDAIYAVDLEILFADEAETPELTVEERASLDIQTISHGEKVKLKDYLAKGKYTIVDFTAEWCKPCQILSPKLDQLVKNHDNVALRVVDIIDWKSDIAKHATKKYKLKGLPFVRVYGPDGKHLGDVTGLQIEKIVALIEGEQS